MSQKREPRAKSREPGERGFTLIETIITLVVLSIAAVGVLSVFTVGIKGSANPGLVSQATQLGQGEMDYIVGQKAASGGFNSIVSSPSCSMTMLAGFTCSRTVCFVPAGNLNDQSACGTATVYKHVTVTVTNAAIGNVTVEGLVTNY